MSIVPGNSQAIVIPDDDQVEGLEDFGDDDGVMPTLKINHPDGKYEDGLSGQQFDELEVILLGVVKQRVLWPPEIEEEAKAPLCRSFENTIGRPDIERFPWKESGFAPDGDENQLLACSNCALKEWGSHPTKDVPWCSQQFTFPLLRKTDKGIFVPAVLTLQRSSLKPCNTYLSSFKNNRTPTFTAVTRLRLDAKRKGSVKFAIPMLARVGETDEQDWPAFAAQFRHIRDFIQRPRQSDNMGEEEEVPKAPTSAPVAVTNAAPPAPAPAPAPTAAPAPAPVADFDDDEEPPF